MKRRKDRARVEPIDLVARPLTLLVTAGILFSSMAFTGSPFPARSGALPPNEALFSTANLQAGIGAALASGKSIPAETALQGSESVATAQGSGGIATSQGSGGEGASLASLPGSGQNQVQDRGLYYSAYVVKPGDTAGAIAENYGVSVDSIISFNDIQNTRALRPGQVLKVPSMAGILAVAKEGDTVDSLAAAYSIGANGIIEANGLLAPTLPAGKVLFLPDAKIPSTRLREINGDLFRWPVRGWITSRYGWRSDPFTGVRSFHDGLDIGIDMGTPVGAAMEGRVIETGYSSSFGNYVLLAHHSGWMSFYGHLNKYIVKSGQWVSQGQTVAYSGNTGYSTGPHLHFTVFKNGRTMNPTVVLH